MNHLKILIYDTNLVPGITRVIPLLKIRGWQKKRAEITILSTKDAEKFYRKNTEDVSFLSINFSYIIKNVYTLPFQYLEAFIRSVPLLIHSKGKFDVVYSQSGVIDFLVGPFLLKIFDRNILWFVMVDNVVPPPNKRPGAYLRNLLPYLAFRFGDLLLRKADGIFVVTDHLYSYYKSKGFRVIKTNDGYGIEDYIFEGNISKNIPKTDALYCGRLHVAKGIFDLVEVMKLIIRTNPSFILGILGDGDPSTKKDFLTSIKSNNLSNNFHMFGYLEGKAKGDIYRNCVYYISLSYDESFGHAILEALACNKRVIAYDLPVYHNVFSKYIKSGQLVLFKEGDFSAIARFMLNKSNKDRIYHNKLSDYKWDAIVDNEFNEMSKSLEKRRMN